MLLIVVAAMAMDAAKPARATDGVDHLIKDITTLKGIVGDAKAQECAPVAVAAA